MLGVSLLMYANGAKLADVLGGRVALLVDAPAQL